jgi:hypothetical protein
MRIPAVVAVVLAFGTPGMASAPGGQWVNLAESTSSGDGIEWIAVDHYLGTLRTLRIDVTAGAVHVRRVVVEFHNGKSSTFEVDRYLTARHPSAYVDLGAPREIDRIVVTTSRSPSGSYEVHGSFGQTQADELVAMN